MEYLDGVLIKLKRKYSKDEVVSALSKKLSESDFKNGELVSELDELKHLLQTSSKENKSLKKDVCKANESYKETHLYKYQRGKIKNYEENWESKKVENQRLHEKLHSLNSELAKLKI